MDVDVTARSINCDLSYERFTAVTSSEIREIRIEGDQRAVPEEYLDVMEEKFTSEDEMVEKLLADLYKQFIWTYF